MEAQASINVDAERRDVRYLVIEEASLVAEEALSDSAIVE